MYTVSEVATQTAIKEFPRNAGACELPLRFLLAHPCIVAPLLDEGSSPERLIASRFAKPATLAATWAHAASL